MGVGRGARLSHPMSTPTKPPRRRSPTRAQREAVARQLGREPRGLTAVAVVCPYGVPAVVESAPYLENGAPFPTLLYLSCPSAVSAIARLEAAGGVETLRRRVAEDPQLAQALSDLQHWYQARRRTLARVLHGAVDGGAVLERGIGGPESPERATCLHAYAAALLAAEGESVPSAGDAQSAQVSESCRLALLGSFGRLWCEDRRCAPLAEADPAPARGETTRRAAIDVGTNSVRLLVADVIGGRPQALVRYARVTRLGESLETRGRLAPDARARTAAVVADYVREARALQAQDTTLVGTSACREAADGRDFVAELGRRFSVEARVVSGELEARLAYSGATLDLPGNVVLLDIGGGSTELVTRLEGGELVAASLRMGSVRGTERWFGADLPSSAERAAAREAVRELVGPLRDRFGAGSCTPRSRLVGVAGTVTTMACLALGLADYDADALHLSTVSRQAVAAQVDRLAGLTAAERRALPCMQPGREGVIVAGGEVMIGVMEALGWEELTVSERDILDGILLAADRGDLWEESREG